MRNPDPLPSVGAAPPASPFHAAIYFTPGLLTKGGKPGASVEPRSSAPRSAVAPAAGWLPGAPDQPHLPGRSACFQGSGPAGTPGLPGPRCRPRVPPPTAPAPVRTALCGLPRKRPGAAALLVHPAPRTAGSLPTRFLGAWRGRVQGGASALKGTGHGAREAAPFETARGACCGAGLGGWWGVGPSGFARGRVVRWERGGVSGVRAAFWAEFRLGGLAPAAPSSRCLGWGGQDSFIPGRGNS